MWVDRHSPLTTKQIIGQKGERSNVRKLAQWLRDWFEHHEARSTRKQHYSKGEPATCTYMCYIDISLRTQNCSEKNRLSKSQLKNELTRNIQNYNLSCPNIKYMYDCSTNEKKYVIHASIVHLQ